MIFLSEHDKLTQVIDPAHNRQTKKEINHTMNIIRRRIYFWVIFCMISLSTMSPTFFHAAVIAGQNFSHNAIIPTQQSGALCVPTEGTVTQRYSSNHPAIDISSVSGQGKGAAVRACATGTVVYVGVAELPQDNPNNVKHAVAIRHDDQIDGKYIMSFYIHMGSDNDIATLEGL